MGAETIKAIRERRSLPQRFHDLAQYSERVIGYTARMSEEDFLSDQDTVAATERCLSIIGDIVDTLNESERGLCAAANFPSLAGLGDYLINDYRSVDPRRVWAITRHDLPPLKQAVEQTMREHFPDVPRS